METFLQRLKVSFDKRSASTLTSLILVLLLDDGLFSSFQESSPSALPRDELLGCKQTNSLIT